MFSWTGSKSLDKLTAMAARYAEGDLAAVLNLDDFPPAYRSLVGHVAGMAELLRGFAGETQVAAGQASSAAHEVSGAIGRANKSAASINSATIQARQFTRNIADAAEQVTGKLNEVMAATQTMTAVASEIYQSSAETKLLAEQGGRAVKDVGRVMEEIKQSSADIEGRVMVLNQMARKIDSLLATIGGISTQTNLLALNAAIEAARAGEHGRGFAVVAGEIQKLSDASAAAASSANALLARIDEGIAAAVKAAAAGSASVEAGTHAMASAGDSLQAILAATAGVEKKVAYASDARKEQLDSTQSAVEFLEQMSQMCRETAAQVEDITQAVEKQKFDLQETEKMGNILTDVAGHLVEATGKIRLTDLSGDADKNIKTMVCGLQDKLEKLVKHADILSLEGRAHERILADFLRQHPELEAAWTNAGDGRFICSLPPAGIANAATRQWFLEAINGNFFVSAVYVSAISHKPCITIALPIKNAAGNTVGVLGVDLRI